MLVPVKDELIADLRELAAQRRRPLEAVVEECLRAEIARRTRYRVEPHDAGPAPGVDPSHFNRLAADDC